LTRLTGRDNVSLALLALSSRQLSPAALFLQTEAWLARQPRPSLLFSANHNDAEVVVRRITSASGLDSYRSPVTAEVE